MPADVEGPDPAEVDRELREIAALCTVTAAALPGLVAQGQAVAVGDPWLWRAEDTGAPIGSRGWWAWAGTVLAVAHNTGKITMITRDGVLNDAFEIALARGGVR